MIDTILLGAIALEIPLAVAAVCAGRKVPAAPNGAATLPSRAPEAPPAAVPAPPTENDLRVQALIREIDPTWQLGDSRAHVELVAGPDGHVASARLR